MSFSKSQEGFSLVEVMASLVILSVVLLSFSQIIIMANKTAIRNNEQIIVTNLAEAELKRLAYTAFNGDGAPFPKDKVNDIFTNPLSTPITTTKNLVVNEVNYKIETNFVQRGKDNTKEHSDFELSLIDTTVNVTSYDGKTNSTVEGYLEYEKEPIKK